MRSVAFFRHRPIGYTFSIPIVLEGRFRAGNGIFLEMRSVAFFRHRPIGYTFSIPIVLEGLLRRRSRRRVPGSCIYRRPSPEIPGPFLINYIIIRELRKIAKK